MKKAFLIAILILIAIMLFACQDTSNTKQIVATTLPVYEFSQRLCQGTDISVIRLINEEISCLHDYTLQVSQMRAIESSQLVILSGAGLENFMTDALSTANACVDASRGIALLCAEHEDYNHSHAHHHDPHIWLSPANAKIMAYNICDGLKQIFPEYTDLFIANLHSLIYELDTLTLYGSEMLGQLSCRNLITFHDGFSYFSDAFDLTILHSLEEESGSEASASELIEIINILHSNHVPAIFTESNGSSAAADIIAAEIGVKVYSLDMAMAGDSYFDAMYDNIKTIKEALG